MIGSEARAGSPGAAAPPGQRRRRRRLQRPRQGRIMRPRSWPGRSGPRGSERTGPAGPNEGRWPRSTHQSPEPCLESTAVRPPEVNPRGQRRRACAVQAAPRAPGRGDGLLRRSPGLSGQGLSGTGAPKEWQFPEKVSFQSQAALAKVKDLQTEIRKGKDGGYGLPQGPTHALSCHPRSRVLPKWLEPAATS